MEERLTKLERNMQNIHRKVDVLAENIYKNNPLEFSSNAELLARVSSKEFKEGTDLIKLGEKKKKKKMRSKKLKKRPKKSKRPKRTKRSKRPKRTKSNK